MAKKMYLTVMNGTTHLGQNPKLNGTTFGWAQELLSENVGTNSGSARLVNTVTGSTNGVEWVNSLSYPIEWLSEPLSADFTIAGTITVNLWGIESSMSANAAINVVIDKIDGATGTLTQIAKSSNVVELATSIAVNNFTVTPTSTTCKRGDRLRARVFIDDVGTMATGFTCSFYYDGTTAGSQGDSYITFTENLTFETFGPSNGVESGGNSGQTFGDTTNQQLAQSFVTKGSAITEVSASLLKGGSPTDNVIVEIQTDNAGNPSGTVVSSGTVATVAASSLSGTLTQIFWSGLNIAVSPATTYWLVFRRSGTLSASNFYQASMGASSSSPSFKSYSGSAWGVPLSGYVMTHKITFSGFSTYYLTSTNETINPGSSTEKVASTTRGSSATTAITNTAAGPTAGIQVTATGGGTAIEWYTPPLEAITFGGKAKFNVRAYESSVSANASLRAEIAITAGDGTGATVWGTGYVEPGATSGEIVAGVSDSAVYAVWVSGDDTAITAGQRLRFRVYVEDIAIADLASGQTVSFVYSGTTANATGDAYVVLPVAVTEQVTGPQTYYGVVALPMTFGQTIQGQRKTFGVTASAYIFTKAVAGAKIFYGQVALPLTFTKAVIGQRKTFGITALPITFTKAVVGQRKTFGQVAAPLTFTKDVVGQRKTFGVIARPITFTAVTNGTATTGGVTYFGVVALPMTFTKATQGVRTALGQVAVPLTFTKAVVGQRKTFGVTALPITFTKAVIGQRKTFGQTATNLLWTTVDIGHPTAGVAGQRKTFGVTALPITFTKAVAGDIVGASPALNTLKDQFTTGLDKTTVTKWNDSSLGAYWDSSGLRAGIPAIAASSYARTILASSPLAYWRLDDPSGTTAADASGNGRTGTYVGGPTLAQSKLIGLDGTAVSLDGTNDYIDFGTAIANAIGAGGAFTIEGWFTPANTSIKQAVFAFNRGSGANGPQIYYSHPSFGGAGKFSYFDATAFNGFITANAYTGGPYFLVWRQAADGTATFRVNGSADGTSGATGNAALALNDTFQIGMEWDAGPVTSDFLFGKMDEVAVFSGTLSDAVVDAHYQAGLQTVNARAGNYISTLYSNNSSTYNLTGSFLSARMYPPTSGSSGLREMDMSVIRAQSGDGNADNRVAIRAINGGANNGIAAWHKVGGAWVAVGSSVAYNSTTHAWWRIRESAGTVYFETSSDGQTWNALASETAPFNVTKVVPSFECYWPDTVTDTTADGFVDTINIGMAYGVVALPITFTKAVIGQRKTFGQTATTLTFTKAVVGQRNTFGVTALPITFTKAVIGQRKTFGLVARPTTITIVTNGTSTVGAITYTKAGYTLTAAQGSGAKTSAYSELGSLFTNKTTGDVDDFNRANENPLSGGGNWANLRPSLANHLLINTNKVVPSGQSGGSISYWTPATYTNVEVMLTVASLPTEGGGAAWVNSRLSDVGTSLWNGYEFGIVCEFGTTFQFILEIVVDGATTGGVSTYLGQDPGEGLPIGPFAASPGDKIMMVNRGNRHEGWHYTGGQWILRCVWVDSTYLGSGNVGMELQGSTTVSADDFTVHEIGASSLSGVGSKGIIKFGSSLTYALSAGADVAERAELGSIITTAQGAGIDSEERVETGLLRAFALESGVDAEERVETGSVSPDTTFSGVKSAESPVTGSILAFVLDSGVDSHEDVNTGSLRAFALASGIDAATLGRTGSLLAFVLTGGVGSKAGTYVKAGSFLAFALSSGIDANQLGRAGSILAYALSSGVKSAESPVTGSILSPVRFSGVKAPEFINTGSLAAFALSSGADVSEHSELGSLLAFVLTGGIGSKAGESIKFGTMLTAIAFKGADVFNPVETGSILSPVRQFAVDSPEYAKTASVLAKMLLAGVDSATLTKLGSILAYALESGIRVSGKDQTGSIRALGLTSGADAALLGRAGSVTPNALTSGAKSASGSKTTKLLTTILPAGAKAYTSTKTGATLADTLTSAARIREKVGKTGSLVALARASGFDVSTHAETGDLVTKPLEAATKIYQAVETGSLIVEGIILEGSTPRVSIIGIENMEGLLVVVPVSLVGTSKPQNMKGQPVKVP